jgi:hypothetical protein
MFFSTLFRNPIYRSQRNLPPSEEILNKKYDLILFGYQVWYLTPSIPIISFLKVVMQKYPERYSCSYHFRNQKYVDAFSGKTESIFKGFKAKLVGNIALVDRHDNYTSVLTILRWLTTGQKKIRNASCRRSF